MAKAKQIYSEGKQVNITNEKGDIVDVYMVRGSVMEVRQEHGNSVVLRHIITVTWDEDDRFGFDYGTHFDGLREMYSNHASAIRQCISLIDECAGVLAMRISASALTQIRRAVSPTDDNGDPLF